MPHLVNSSLGLPPEVLSLVLTFGSQDCWFDEPRAEHDLSFPVACSQVNRHWHVISIPHIYRFITFSCTRQARLLLRSLSLSLSVSRPYGNYTAHVRSLDFISSYNEAPPVLIGNMVEKCTQLRELRIPAYVAPMLVDVPSYRALTHLTIKNSVAWRMRLSSKDLPPKLKLLEVRHPNRGNASESDLPPDVMGESHSPSPSPESDTDRVASGIGPSRQLRRLQGLTLSFLTRSSDNMVQQLFDPAQFLHLKKLVLYEISSSLQVEVESLILRTVGTLRELHLYGGRVFGCLAFGAFHISPFAQLRSFKSHVTDAYIGDQFESLSIGREGGLISLNRMAKVALPGSLEQLELSYSDVTETVRPLLRLLRNPRLFPNLKRVPCIIVHKPIARTWGTLPQDLRDEGDATVRALLQRPAFIGRQPFSLRVATLPPNCIDILSDL